MAESSLIVAAFVGDPLFHDHLLAIRLAKDDRAHVSDLIMVVGRFVEQLPGPQVACEDRALLRLLSASHEPFHQGLY
jgi:hypothetical protein